MAKIKTYKLKSSNVHLCNKIFYKRDNVVLSTENLPAGKLEDAEKAGFIYEVNAEIKKTVLTDSEFPEDMPGREELISNGITTFEQLDSVEDLTELTGIGVATAKKINIYLAENN